MSTEDSPLDSDSPEVAGALYRMELLMRRMARALEDIAGYIAKMPSAE